MKVYTCGICQGEFRDDTREEYKEEEFAKNFPGETIDKNLSVCDGCYKKHVLPILQRQA